MTSSPRLLTAGRALVRRVALLTAIVLCCMLLGGADSPLCRIVPAEAAARANAPRSVYDFAPLDISGERVPLSRYKGDVLIIVNTASLCGNTPQYGSLETLYQKYKARGLRIAAFPANNFASQEPGDNKQISQFCFNKYHVTFDLFSKISVAGSDQAPLYSFLTSPATDRKFAKPIEWNFAKFLIDRQGRIVNRFPAGHDPLSPDVVAAIEHALAAPAK